MTDKEKVIKGLEICVNRVPGKYDCNECPYEIDGNDCEINLTNDALTLLKEYSSLIGTRVTADGITFISTGTAQAGEARGLLLGKMTMHEWLKKELFYRGLLTDEIRAVFDEAKRREM